MSINRFPIPTVSTRAALSIPFGRALTALCFVALAIVWGSSFVLVKVCLQGLSPALITASRLAIGSAVLLVVCWRRHVLVHVQRRWVGHVVLAAALGNVAPYLLLSYGERGAGAGMAGVLVGATPLLTAAIAVVAKQEVITRSRTIALALGFVGIVMLVAPWRTVGGVGGAIACFCAALSYAAGFVHARRFLATTGASALTLATAQLVAALALQVVLAPLFAWNVTRVSPSVMAAALVLGVVGTGLAYVLYFRLITDLGATRAASVDYVVPVVAVLLAVVVLSEPITWNLVVGGLIVAAAIAYDHLDGLRDALHRRIRHTTSIAATSAAPAGSLCTTSRCAA